MSTYSEKIVKELNSLLIEVNRVDTNHPWTPTPPPIGG